MVNFKKNIEGLLPYDRQEYLEFLDDDFDKFSTWNAVSIQLKNNEEDIDLAKVIKEYEILFKKMIINLDNHGFWIICHDDMDLNWFPNNKNNLNSLRSLFKKNGVENSYRGAILFKEDDLFFFAKDLISYSYVLSYKNLDISHSELPFIVKLTNHLTIDLLSTNENILRDVLKIVPLDSYNIKEYRGTSLKP